MLNVKKTFALAIIALFIGLIAYSTAASITSSTNGTNFTFNLSGQPAMDNFSTIVCGVNMTCSQNSTPDNHTIYINSLGAGGGSGTVTQINQGTGIILVPNPITTTGTAYLNGVSCNPANQASVLNSSGGLECVSNIDTGIGAEVDPFSVHWNVFANAVHNNESEPSFNANYSNLVNVTNNSYVLRNQTWSRQNTTIDQSVDFKNNSIYNVTYFNNTGITTYFFWYGANAIAKPIFDFVGTPQMIRNISVSVGSPQGSLVVGLKTQDYPNHIIDNGGGPSLLFQIQDASGNMNNVGRINFIWENRTANTSEFAVFVKKDNTDTFSQNQKAMSIYSNGTVVFWAYAGIGNRPACFYPNGTVYPGTINVGTGLCN